MSDYLWNFGLEDFEEKDDTLMGLIAKVIEEGKVIESYYGKSYINKTYGRLQIVARVRQNENGVSECCGFDTHCTGRNVWELRILNDITDSDDPLSKKLMLKGMDGSGILPVDIVNADVLPNFSEDEVVKLQMVAFAEEISFYEDEEAYTKTVKPGLNGHIIRIGNDTLFPLGLFQETDKASIKDIVQIHGTIEKAYWGNLKFGKEDDEELKTFILCEVKTQYGNIDIVVKASIVDRNQVEWIRPGAVADCLAYLSGDPKIYELDNGRILNEENNLKLIGYTFERGDPERLRNALDDRFVYHSENSGKHFEDIDEFVKFVKVVQKAGSVRHSLYATITEYTGEEAPEYPVGTRCIVLKYDDEEGYNSIVFMDLNEEGRIHRILLSKDSRYRFQLDPKLPEPETPTINPERSVNEALFLRAQFFGLFSKRIDIERVQSVCSDNKETFLIELSHLLQNHLNEDGTELKRICAEAFLCGVKMSRVKNYDNDEILRIGECFYKDIEFKKEDAKNLEIIKDALLFIIALGYLYEGRVGEHD